VLPRQEAVEVVVRQDQELVELVDQVAELL